MEPTRSHVGTDHRIITDLDLQRGLADPSRVNQAVAQWRKDPDEYVRLHGKALTDYDFPVFAQGNLKIKDKGAALIWFSWNRVQRQLWRWLLEDLARGRPIRWFIVKARQMGVSTWILAFFYWLSLRANRNALILAHDEDAVENFNGHIVAMHTHSHPFLKPTPATMKRDLIHFDTPTIQKKAGKGEPGLDSRIIFQTAKKMNVGRSYNLHCVLLSEYALWPGEGIVLKDVMQGLSSAVAKLPGTIVVKESTAKGENEAKTEWDDPSSGYRKIFVPWVALDEYSTELDEEEELDLCAAEDIGGADTRYGDELTEAELIRAGLIRWTEPGEEYRLTEEWLDDEILRRLKWRRGMIDTDFGGDKMRFRQEYPTIPEHAFGATSRNCFDSGSIALMRVAVEDEGIEPLRCNYIHKIEELDPEKKFLTAPYGRVHLYRMPEHAEEQFVIGGDTSLGLSAASDPSALIVLAVPELEEVASFNGVIPPEQLGEMAYYLGQIFNWALLGVEFNESGGAVANTVLSKYRKYPRLYHARDPFTKKRTIRPGFHTDNINKSSMVSELAQVIRDHEILLRSPGLIHAEKGQLLHYEEKPDGTLGAALGWKDDMVSALLIAVFLSSKVHQFPRPAQEIPKGSFAEAAEQIRRKHAPNSKLIF